MLKDGIMKTGHDSLQSSNLNGVFLFDLKNFTKRWCNTGVNIDGKKISLAQALFAQASKSSDIVVLRVPTKNMPLDKLRCRCQSFLDELTEHIKNGDAATRQKHYTAKRKSIEYIFQQDIPIANIKKLGNTNSGVTFDESDISAISKIDVMKILSDIFKGCPEEKCINLANNSSIKFQEMPI